MTVRPSGPGGLLTARDEVAGQSGDVVPVLEGDRELASVVSLGMSLTAMQAALPTPTYPMQHGKHDAASGHRVGLLD